MSSVQNVDRGFLPLDRRLQLLEQLSWSPGTIARALRIGSEIPMRERPSSLTNRRM